MPNMTPPLTAERALEMARELANEAHCRYCDVPDWNKCKRDLELNTGEIAVAILRLLAAEASEEVCVCGHDEREHSLMDALADNDQSKCCDGCPGKFLSRRAFLDEQARKVEEK